MGKVKIKRKSTLIDMTAMSDVTVLLLTFFMLTSTFLQKEPVTVITPASVSELKVPINNVTTVLVSPKGEIFLGVLGDADSTYSSEKVRADILQNAVTEYNKTHSKKVQLTQEQVNKFANMNMFGMPIAQLPAFLDESQVHQDEIMQGKRPEWKIGIPVDGNQDLANPNEFQIWMRAIYNSNDNMEKTIKSGEGIAVKADADTPYDIVHTVLDNLQTLKMNKFSLLTALKTEND
ncbi:biopolymer transporter ExbD [uncultured Muribaculum sp.]|uniref:ExbD/TolR family protein n=1 Tax=uncultured Muribaculum sp. TaxID=1918613 RepID=UPI0025B478B3|nr:biopolymer transporter ExbD [uncultured Muribaculum sp.]